MEENENNKINKTKVISNAITISLAVIFTVVVIGCLYVVTKPFIQGKNDDVSTDEKKHYLETMGEAYDMLTNKYFGEVDIYEAQKSSIEGLANSVGDVYTRYMTEEEYNEMLTSGSEEFVGIGVHITYDNTNNAIYVVGIMPDSPALSAGLQKGDLILKVDDLSVTYDSYKKCVDTLKGIEGTTARVLVKRGEEKFELQIQRKKLTNNDVESEILENNIGYIKVWQFENEVYNQFKKEYDKMIQNIDGLIIDLRDNPGGMVSQTIKMLDLLLPRGEVLRLVYKDGTTKVYKCSDDKQIEIPLVVLVNENSASASEIFASAIKDSKKGVVIGEKTYGKGIVQEVEKLQSGGALSITVAKYYTISGVEIHKNGIEPNIVVSLPDEVKNLNVIPKDKDLQLQSGVDYILRNK